MDAKAADEARQEAKRIRDYDVELAEAAYKMRLRSIAILAMNTESARSAPTEPPSSAKSKRLRRGELPRAFERILPKLEPTFDKGDVFRMLRAVEPATAERTNERAVSLMLGRLAGQGSLIEVEIEGEGRAPTTYRQKRKGPTPVESAREDLGAGGS